MGPPFPAISFFLGDHTGLEAVCKGKERGKVGEGCLFSLPFLGFWLFAFWGHSSISGLHCQGNGLFEVLSPFSKLHEGMNVSQRGSGHQVSWVFYVVVSVSEIIFFSAWLVPSGTSCSFTFIFFRASVSHDSACVSLAVCCTKHLLMCVRKKVKKMLSCLSSQRTPLMQMIF